MTRAWTGSPPPGAPSARAAPVTPRRAGRLTLRYLSPRSLGASELEEIWHFFSRFVAREKEPFLARVRAVEEIYLGRDEQGVLRAFGSTEVFTATWEGRAYGLIYTAWAAIDPAYRGRNLTQRIGLRTYVRYRLRHPTHRVYWFFWASTYKSYLLMARNAHAYWPRRGTAWPAREAALVAQAMEQMADPGWDPERGIVRRFGASRYHDGSYATDPGALRDPDVRFYAELNPDQHLGDTVVCLAALSLRTWARAISRMLARGLRRREHA